MSVLDAYIISLYNRARSTMMKKMLTIRATETELSILARFADQSGRTQSDVLREFLRSLEKKLVEAAPTAKAAKAVKPKAKKR